MEQLSEADSVSKKHNQSFRKLMNRVDGLILFRTKRGEEKITAFRKRIQLLEEKILKLEEARETENKNLALNS